MNTSSFKIHWSRSSGGERSLMDGPAPKPSAAESVAHTDVPARVARLVALAHRLQTLVRSGVVRDLAHAARLARITRARASQIADLGLLAPDVQEEVLFLEKPPRGREPITERHLRRIVREPDWQRQRQMWRAIRDRVGMNLH
ncbi:MAG: hypothetical protein IBJ18_02090 [Phycisphaerales bacterium]|nr:hypothetical protein [Phycisphaerales bacterium]